MTDYVQRDMLDVYEGEISKKKVKTPATEHLFRIEKNIPQLDKRQAEHFHTMVAKGLFVTNDCILMYKSAETNETRLE